MSLIKLNSFTKKYSGLDLGLDLDSFSSRSQTLSLEIFRSRSRSWSRKNFTVSVSVSNHVVSTISLLNILSDTSSDKVFAAPTTSHLNVVVQSPFLHWDGSKWLFNSPRAHPRAVLHRTTLLIFYPCCPMRGHIWTAFLNPIDRPPNSSTFFRTTLLSLSFHPKPLHYLFHPSLILISSSVVIFTPTLAL